jgi:branched-chain amino acid transport system substrate-binding protein
MFKEMKDIFRLTVLLIVIAFSLLGVGVNAAQQEPIKIGFLTPLTGPAAQGGKDQYDGFMMGIDSVGGKAAGRPIKVILEDDAWKPDVALAKARKLAAEDKVLLISGPMAGHACLALYPYINEQEMPFMPCCMPDDFTQRKRSPFIIRTTGAGSQLSHPLGEWAYKNLKIKKVVIMGMDYSYGHEVSGGFHRTFEEAGGQVIQRIWSPLNALDLAPYISQINREADAVFATYVGSLSLRFAKQFQEAGLYGKMVVLGANTTTDESALNFMGDEAIGYITSNNWSAALDTPAAKRFVAEYNRRYNIAQPSYFAEMFYDTAIWIVKAIESLKGNVEDKNKLLEALRQVKLPDAPRGPLELDKYNNVIQNIYIRKVEKVKGVLQNTVIATYPKVSQFWKYNPEEFLKQPVYSRDQPPCRFCK